MKVFIVLALTVIGTKASILIVGPQKMTQADADQYCDAKYGNLFKTITEEDYHRLAKLASESGQKMWIGAKEAAEGDWRWLSDNSSASIPKTMFDRGEPNNWGGNEECLLMKPNGKLNDAHCGKRFAFACYY